MKDKILTVVMSVSMALIGISTVITTGASFMNVVLPDVVIRALGIVQLLSLGTMAYSTVQKMRSAKAAAEEKLKTAVETGENHET